MFDRHSTKIVLLLGLMGLGLSSNAWAAKPRLVSLKPKWARSSQAIARHPNVSYLSDLGQQSVSPGARLLDNVFDTQSSDQLRYRYERMMQDYEVRHVQRFGSLDTEQNHVSRMQELTKDAVKDVRSRQVRIQSKKLETAAEQNQELRPLRQPLAVAAALAAIYNGTPMMMTLGFMDSKVIAATNVRERKANLTLDSPFLTSSVDFSGNSPANPDGLNFDPTQQGERYRLSLSRDLPIWNLQTGFSYGGTSNLITASLSKKLMPNLTCELGSTRSASDTHTTVPEQETLKLFYAIQF